MKAARRGSACEEEKSGQAHDDGSSMSETMELQGWVRGVSWQGQGRNLGEYAESASTILRFYDFTRPFGFARAFDLRDKTG